MTGGEASAADPPHVDCQTKRRTLSPTPPPRGRSHSKGFTAGKWPHIIGVFGALLPFLLPGFFQEITMRIRTCFQTFGALLICMHAAFADDYDDCILESMKSVTSNDAAIAIRNACTNKFSKLVELNDVSFLDGSASYDPPNLWVTINNKSDIRIQSVTIFVQEKRTGKVNYYNLLNATGGPSNVAAMEPRAVTRAMATITEQTAQSVKFPQEYDWGIARATAYDNSVKPAQASPCASEELTSRNGDCWIKLSNRDKFLFTAGFDRGFSASWDDIERQQYSTLGKNELKFSYVHRDLVAYFDQLYGDVTNRSISWRDAFDLARREEVSHDDSDLAALTAMYREHREPLYSGYLRKFIPPNKVVVSTWPDSPAMSAFVKEYGNPTGTFTLFGLSDDATTAALDKFMRLC
jgi:hypothetical protein